MKKNDLVKGIIIAIGVVICILWFLTEVIHVLPDALIWPLRICVIVAALAMFWYVARHTSGGGKKGKTR